MRAQNMDTKKTSCSLITLTADTGHFVLIVHWLNFTHGSIEVFHLDRVCHLF